MGDATQHGRARRGCDDHSDPRVARGEALQRGGQQREAGRCARGDRERSVPAVLQRLEVVLHLVQ
jgi:hypothetical protein